MISTTTTMIATTQTNQTRKPNAPDSDLIGLGGVSETFTDGGTAGRRGRLRGGL